MSLKYPPIGKKFLGLGVTAVLELLLQALLDS